MSEVMAVESIIEAYWQLQGYFTKTRVSVKKQGGYLDIDVLGYKINEGVLAFAESKAHGEKDKIFSQSISLTDYHSFVKYQNETEEFKKKKKAEKNKQKKNDLKGPKCNINDRKKEVLNFFHNVYFFLEEHEKLSIDIKHVKKIEILFVSNCYYKVDTKLEEKLKQNIQNLLSKLRKGFLVSKIPIDIHFKTHYDIVIDITKRIKETDTGKRFGHPVLDLLREVCRHLFFKRIDGINLAPDDFKKELRQENEEKIYSMFISKSDK